MASAQRVFLSYAREDLAFVESFVDALIEEGVDAWIDLEGLLSGEEFWPRIQEAIEGAELFVAVLSPDWATSVPCRREFEHALANHKRILPVLAREVDSAQLSDAVAKLNWVLVRDDAEVPPAAKKVARALDEDPDWVRRITALLVQAQGWDDGRSRGRLLRGAELKAAQDLLSEAGRHGDPQPTALQTEFVVASTRHAGRVRGYIIAGVLSALVLVSAAAVVAFVQRGVARSERSVAVSRELAARSGLAAGRDSVEALELAIEAAETHPTREAEQALRDALRFSRVRHVIEDTALGHRVGAISPDGARLLFYSPHASTLRIVDTESAESLAVLSGHEDRVISAHFLSDGERILTASMDSTARIWSTRTGETLRIYEGHDAPIKISLVSPDETMAVTADAEGFIRTWRIDDGGDVAVGDLGEGQVFLAAAFHPYEMLCAFAVAHGAPFLWEPLLGRGRSLSIPGVERGIYGLGFSPAGRFLVTTGRGPMAVRLWEAGTGEPVRSLDATGRTIGPESAEPLGGAIPAFDYPRGSFLHAPIVPQLSVRSLDGYVRSLGHEERRVASASFGQDGKLVVTNDFSGSVRVWAVDSGSELGGIRIPAWSPNAGSLITPDGRFVVTNGNDGRTLVWETDRSGEALSLKPGIGWYEDLAIDSSGETLYGALLDGDQGILTSWSLSDGRERRLARVDGEQPGGPTERVIAMLSTPDARGLLVVRAHGEIRELDPETGEVRQELGSAFPILSRALLSPDGSLLLGLGPEEPEIGHADRGALWDVASGQVQAYLEGWVSRDSNYLFSEDGSKLLAHESFDVRVWETETGSMLLEDAEAPAGSVALAPDGEDLFLAGPEGLWRYRLDTDPAAPAGSVDGHFAFVASPPGIGEIVAVRGDDGSVLTLDRSLETTISSHPGFPRLPQRFAVSDEGRYVAGLGYQGSLNLLELRGTGPVNLADADSGYLSGGSFFFTPDSRYLVVETGGTVNVYYTTVGDLLAAARARRPGVTRTDSLALSVEEPGS